MKFILAFIAAVFLLSSVPETAHCHSQKGQSATASKRKKRIVKRGTGTVVTPNPSPIGQTPSGLIYVITRHGNGKQAQAGDTVMVNYTGLLTNGMKFDSSLDRGQPFSFPLGAGRVIKGWDEGIAKLRVGDQATLIIPSALGYGATGVGTIPPDATLIFIVELMGIQEKSAPN
jgi:FKBP-type peptidyl-prolyl cis-trans isomerase